MADLGLADFSSSRSLPEASSSRTGYRVIPRPLLFVFRISTLLFEDFGSALLENIPAEHPTVTMVTPSARRRNPRRSRCFRQSLQLERPIGRSDRASLAILAARRATVARCVRAADVRMRPRPLPPRARYLTPEGGTGILIRLPGQGFVAVICRRRQVASMGWARLGGWGTISSCRPAEACSEMR